MVNLNLLGSRICLLTPGSLLAPGLALRSPGKAYPAPEPLGASPLEMPPKTRTVMVFAMPRTPPPGPTPQTDGLPDNTLSNKAPTEVFFRGSSTGRFA